MTNNNNNNSSSLPPLPLHGSRLYTVLAPYSLLFLIGLIGNISVLSYVCFLVRSLRPSSLFFSTGNTFVYIVSLSLVDTLVVMSIPFHMTNAMLQNWIFGTVACKIYWILEMSNKVLSTFILTAMAFDRYMAICRPEITFVHEIKNTIAIISVLVLVALSLLLPIAYSAKVVAKPLLDQLIYSSGEYRRMETHICTDGMDRRMHWVVSGYIFLLGFILPALLIALFYALLLLRLRRVQSRMIVVSKIPMRRVTVYTMAIAIFYYCCSLPYWLTQCYAAYTQWARLPPPTKTFLHILYVSHMFPFVNSAFNWLLYAQLNTQFRKGLHLVTEKMIKKHKMITNSANDPGRSAHCANGDSVSLMPSRVSCDSYKMATRMHNNSLTKQPCQHCGRKSIASTHHLGLPANSRSTPVFAQQEQ